MHEECCQGHKFHPKKILLIGLIVLVFSFFIFNLAYAGATPSPDLSVSSVVIKTTNVTQSVLAGDLVQIEAKIDNLGTTNSTNNTVKIFINSFLVAEDTYTQGSIGSNGILYKRGIEASKFFADLNIIEVEVVDNTNDVGVLPDFNLSNNKRKISVVINSAIDLSINHISASPTQPIVNQPVKITIYGKYVGILPLASYTGLNAVAFVSEDFEYDGNNNLSPSPLENPLHNGDSYTYTYNGYFTAGGNKTIGFGVDTGHQIVETNENNNTYSKIINVLKAGDLIKLATDSAIYKIDTDGLKHLFVNSPTFWSHYTGTWSALKLNGTNVYIQTISQTAFDSIPVGKNMVVKSGSKLIKFQNSPKVYLVFGNAKLKNISEQSALSLFDANWRNNLVIIQNGFESSYTRADGDFLDSDNDGLSDEDEINIYSTNPNNSDSDSDGYKDGVEVLGGFNPNGAGKL